MPELCNSCCRAAWRPAESRIYSGLVTKLASATDIASVRAFHEQVSYLHGTITLNRLLSDSGLRTLRVSQIGAHRSLKASVAEAEAWLRDGRQACLGRPVKR